VNDFDKILDLLACNSLVLSEIQSDNKKLIELLEEYLCIKKDSVLLTEGERKLQMWLSTTKNKIISNTYRIPEKLQDSFKKKCSEEGYSTQEGIARLVQSYVDGTFIIKDSSPE